MELDVCWMNVREFHTGFVQQVSAPLLASTAGSDVIRHKDESHTGSLRRPSCIKGGLAALCFCCFLWCRLHGISGLVFRWF